MGLRVDEPFNTVGRVNEYEPFTIVVPVKEGVLDGLAHEIGSKQYKAFIYYNERKAAIGMREGLEKDIERRHRMLGKIDV